MIGLSTYSFFWEHKVSLPDGPNLQPLDLHGMLRATADRGMHLLQICDYAPLFDIDEKGLADLRGLADSLGIQLELGTRGVTPSHLERMLNTSLALGATFVRSMLSDANSRPSSREAERWLRQELPHWEAAGVTLALETYEQIPVAELVDLVVRIDSPSLGICLDPANSVAALENPRDTVEQCAPYVAGLHIKDFAFTRHDEWVGFRLAGAPLGHGLLDYQHLMDTVQPEGRGIHRVVEHWLPWQGTQTDTIRLEREWTTTALAYMKEN